MTSYALHYGKSRKVLVHVLPDEKYPTMWRIHWPDGSISDMVNLTRATEAGAVLLRRRHPELDWKLLHWDRTRNDAVAALARFDPTPMSSPAESAW
jgi:hypothetical protein